MERHRVPPRKWACAGVCAGDLGSTSGTRIEWIGWVGGRGADPPDGPRAYRRSGSGRRSRRPTGSPKSNQGLPPVHGLREGRSSSSSPSLSPRGAHLLLLHPLQGQPEGGGVQAAAGAGSIRGMVEVEIGVA